jgi:UDPglucose--hexose-1-phosphate uridylyltransferase
VPEYRQNPLTGQTVIVSAERGSRPHYFDIEAGLGVVEGSKLLCPFCEGNEYLTPGEVASIRDGGTFADASGWRVRVIPNKFPAVCSYSDIPTYSEFQANFEFGSFPFPFGLVERFVPAVGVHEVLIDTPRHVVSVSDMTLCEVVNMFRMYRMRLDSFRAGGQWVYVQIFKNVGVAAGASIPHSHSQLIAIPFVPLSVQTVLQRAAEFRDGNNDCFWCRQLESEMCCGLRVVEATDSFVAICPFASRFASELEIYPKEHESFLDSFRDEGKLEEFSELVCRTVLRLERAVFWIRGKLAYNFVLHVEPFVHSFGQNLFHWHLSILPSLARAAGFEWGTGLHINPIPPETAAEKLRNA